VAQEPRDTSIGVISTQSNETHAGTDHDGPLMQDMVGDAVWLHSHVRNMKAVAGKTALNKLSRTQNTAHSMT